MANKKIGKKSKKPRPAARRAAPARATRGVTAGSTKDVPRNNVGAAVQAAITFENATTVTAVATDAGATLFDVSWS